MLVKTHTVIHLTDALMRSVLSEKSEQSCAIIVAHSVSFMAGLQQIYGPDSHMSFTLLQGKAYAPTVQRHFLIKSAHVNAVKVHVASYGRKFSVD